MRKDAPGPAQGFSLVELLTTLAVITILLGLSLPGFQEALRRQRVATAMHQITAQLAQARNTAVTRREPITVCPSRGDGRCRAEPDWSDGWLVYRDPMRTSQPRSPADILREARQPVHGSIRVISSTGRLRVRYQPSGRSGGNNITIRVCTADRLQGEVIVNNTGRVRTRRGPAVRCDPPT